MRVCCHQSDMHDVCFAHLNVIIRLDILGSRPQRRILHKASNAHTIANAVYTWMYTCVCYMGMRVYAHVLVLADVVQLHGAAGRA